MGCRMMLCMNLTVLRCTGPHTHKHSGRRRKGGRVSVQTSRIPQYFSGHLSEMFLFKLEPLVVFAQPSPHVCWVGRLPFTQSAGHERKHQPLPGGRRNREPACSPRAECWLVTRNILRWDASSCPVGSCLHKASIICRPRGQQAPEAKLKLASTVCLPETQTI